MPNDPDIEAFEALYSTRLTGHGLSSRQVDALGSLVLRMGRALNAVAEPTTTEVKKPIEEIRNHLEVAVRRLSGVIGAAKLNDPPALRDAGNRIFAVASMSGISSDEVEERVKHLCEIVQWCNEALTVLPAQRRKRSGHLTPVARIWEAILKTHDTSKPMTIRPSSSPNSPFREICSICYEAMTGKQDSDPERAVKAFVAVVRKRDRPQRKKWDAGSWK